MPYDYKQIEKDVQGIWKDNKIPEKISNNKAKKFYLLDGPPYVNGVPHVGHVKTTVFKDVWGRFKAMQGFAVWLQPGFDCGGLPIENAVEKKLGIKSKSDIERIGIDVFISECKKFAKGNELTWINMYRKLGAMRGWLEPYLTSENYYIESAWWTIKRLFEKGLLVEGFKPGFWCSHCETILSGYEVTDSYKNVEDPSIYIKFPVKGDEYLLVWTTTPWTLPANVAIAVHPDETYVKVRCGDDILILAEKRLGVLESHKILEKFSGKKLEGMKYKPLLDVPLQKSLTNARMVVASIPLMKKRVASKIKAKKSIDAADEFGHIVTMDTGSGLVHIAPGHGMEDNRLGEHYGLPMPSPVDERGMLTEETGFGGLFVKDADKKIIEYLKERGLLFRHEKIVHSYPLCWRCKSPLIYRMSRQWFLKIDTIRKKMLKENKSIKWMPEFAEERFANLLQDAPDWAVTRQRYWGIPLPVWKCGCGSLKVIGSAEELGAPKDLHKDVVDKIKLKCGCGSEMERIKDVMDVWFDSGIAPWASLGYPFRNNDAFERLWPVDLVDESQDQIRGWFYSLMFCGIAAFDKKPFRAVCLNGWTLDEKGEKMSKSLGNVISAEDAYEKLGSDALRLYCCHDIAPWETQKFSLKNASEMQRHLNIIWNTYEYFRTYSKVSGRAKLRPEERWLLSRLNSIIKNVTLHMENFRFHEAGREIIGFFVNDFSRTYIKIVREDRSPAVGCAMTQVFGKALRLLAPIAPFISERIYTEMFGRSVHLESWPAAGRSSPALESQMAVAMDIVEKANAIRKDENIRLRWPLKKLVICPGKGRGKDVNGIIKNFGGAIKALCNVKNVAAGNAAGGFMELDTAVDEDEALLAELLREIQKARKSMGLVVSDKIELVLNNKDMKRFEKVIKDKVGAASIRFTDARLDSAVEAFNKKAGFNVKAVTVK